MSNVHNNKNNAGKMTSEQKLENAFNYLGSSKKMAKNNWWKLCLYAGCAILFVVLGMVIMNKFSKTDISAPGGDEPRGESPVARIELMKDRDEWHIMEMISTLDSSDVVNITLQDTAFTNIQLKSLEDIYALDSKYNANHSSKNPANKLTLNLREKNSKEYPKVSEGSLLKTILEINDSIKDNPVAISSLVFEIGNGKVKYVDIPNKMYNGTPDTRDLKYYFWIVKQISLNIEKEDKIRLSL